MVLIPMQMRTDTTTSRGGGSAFASASSRSTPKNNRSPARTVAAAATTTPSTTTTSLSAKQEQEDSILGASRSTNAPATKGSLKWFQNRKAAWQSSPRGRPLRSTMVQPTTTTSTATTSSQQQQQQKTKGSFSSSSSSSSSPVKPVYSSSLVSKTPPLPKAPVGDPSKSSTPFNNNNKSPFSFSYSSTPISKSRFSSFPSTTISTITNNNENTPQQITQQEQSAASFNNSTPPPPIIKNNNNNNTKQGSSLSFSAPFSTPPPVSQTITSPTTTSTSGDNSINNHRDRLIQFYKKYNPTKVDSVDSTLASYKGKEELLFRKLNEKYVDGKDGMLPPTGTGPKCYMDFQIIDDNDNEEVGGGRVIIQLFQDKAPLACENFRCLCTGEMGRGVGSTTKDLCYRYSKIHRLVPGMCIQGGDFTKDNGTGGESIYPPNSQHGDMWGKFKDETPFLMHTKKGLLSMANNGPNRNGSQFFFTLKALPYLDGKHVVFGEVVEGTEVLDQINKLESDKKQRPIKTVMIKDCGQLGEDGKEINNNKSVVQESMGAATQQQQHQSNNKSSFGGNGIGTFGNNLAAPKQQPSPFGFGGASNQTSSSSSTSNPFASFSSTSSTKNTTTPLFGSGSAFSFGASAAGQPPPQSLSDTKTTFNFGVPSSASSSTPTTGSFSFGKGTSAASETVSSSQPPKPATGTKTPFNFGVLAASSSTPSGSFSFGQSTSAAAETKSAFPSKDATKEETISFGQGIATTPATEKSSFAAKGATADKNPVFSFGEGSGLQTGAVMKIWGAPSSELSASLDPAQPTDFGQQAKTEDKSVSKSVFGSFPSTATASFSFGSGAGQLATAAPPTKMTSSTLSSTSFNISSTPTLTAAPAPAPAPAAATTPSAPTFAFGEPEKKSGTPIEKPGTMQTTTTTKTFEFGKVQSDLPSSTSAAPEPLATAAAAATTTSKPTFSFGDPPDTSKGTFAFGKPADQPSASVEKTVTPTPSTSATPSSMPVFSFGRTPDLPSVEKPVTPNLASTTTTASVPATAVEKLPDELPKPAWSTASGKRLESATSKGSVASFLATSDPVFPFGQTPEKPDATIANAMTNQSSAFSFGLNPDQTDKDKSFAISTPASTEPTASAFSFGKPNAPIPSSAPTKSAFSFGKPPQPEATKVLKPEAPASTISSASTQTDAKPLQATTEASISQAKSPFAIPKVPQTGSQSVSARPRSRASPSPAKPLLPSFYFGEDRSERSSTMDESTSRKQVFEGGGLRSTENASAATQGASINLDKKLATASEEKQSEREADKDVSFASFSPNFIKEMAQQQTSTFEGFAPQSSNNVPDAIKKAIGGSRQGVSTAHVSPLKKGAWSTPGKPKKTIAISPPRSAQRTLLGGITPGGTCSPGTTPSKGRKEVEEAVADILAERVFYEDELLTKVSVEQVERLMAASMERKIEVLEHIDNIESLGMAFRWDDIEYVLKNGRPGAKKKDGAKHTVLGNSGQAGAKRDGEKLAAVTHDSNSRAAAPALSTKTKKDGEELAAPAFSAETKKDREKLAAVTHDSNSPAAAPALSAKTKEDGEELAAPAFSAETKKDRENLATATHDSNSPAAAPALSAKTKEDGEELAAPAFSAETKKDRENLATATHDSNSQAASPALSAETKKDAERLVVAVRDSNSPAAAAPALSAEPSSEEDDGDDDPVSTSSSKSAVEEDIVIVEKPTTSSAAPTSCFDESEVLVLNLDMLN